MAKNNTVFISYRRDASAFVARAIFQDLRDHNIDAFMDVENIDQGQFDTIIFNQIAARPYFLLVLTPGTLQRCKEAKDMLLAEIRWAYDQDRKIILVYSNNFDFKDIDCYIEPELADELKRYNAVDVPHNYFEAAMERLRSRFLKPLDLSSTPAPHTDTAQVEQKIALAAAEPPVTQQQLTAQEYFEHAYARDESDLDGAIADYTEAIRLNPQFAYAFYRRALARWRNSDLDGAIADYTETIRLDPQDSYAYYLRGLARNRKGDIAGACADYSQVLKLSPENPDATTIRRYIAANCKYL